MSMTQSRDKLSRGIYRPNPVCIVKQHTYLGTIGRIRVSYAKRAALVIIEDLPLFWLSLLKDLKGEG